jgi:hypothetical protein
MGLVIWLFIQHPRLKSAVRDLFGDTEPLESADLGTLAGGQTVVTTTRDISTKECAALAGRGVKVIVLGTGLPGAGEREYLEAGAYLFQEMNLRAGKLADWILAADTADTSALQGLRAAAEHGDASRKRTMAGGRDVRNGRGRTYSTEGH